MNTRIPASQPAGRMVRGWTGLIAVALVCAVCGIYGRVIDGPFLFDDLPYVLERPHSHLPDLSWESISALLSVRTAQPHRWLSHLSFALNFYCVGDSPVSFHVVNIAIHLLTTLGVFLLTRTSFGLLGWQPQRAARAALAAACIFALHPIQTQAVSYIWQRTASLVTCWTVWAVWAYAVGRQQHLHRGWPAYLLSALCIAAAVATKQNGILAPFLILLYDFVFFTDRGKRATLSRVGIFVAMIAIGLIVVMVLWRSWKWSWLVNYSRRDYTMGQRALTQPRVMWLYLKLLAIPWPGLLNIEHHVIPSTRWLSPWTTLPAILGLATLLAGSLACLWRAPALGFGLVWYWAAHVPEGTVIPLELAFEHRNYMPMVGLSLIAGLGFDTLSQRSPRASVAALTIVCLLYAAGTWARNEVYTDAEILWRDAVAKSPRKARPHNNLAEVAAKAGRWEEAEALYRKSMELDPTDSGTYNVLGMMLATQGRVTEAIELYRQSIAIKPDTPGTHHNLGLSLTRLGKFDEAIAACREAIRLKPTFADAYHSLGNAFAQKRDFKNAEQAFRGALKLDPTLSDTYINLSTTLLTMAQFAEAEKLLRRGLENLPDDKGVLNALARLLITCQETNVRNVEEGIKLAARALELTGGSDPLSLTTMAMAMAEQGDFHTAVQFGQEAMQAAARAGQPQMAAQIQYMVDAYRQGRKPKAKDPTADSAGKRFVPPVPKAR